MRLSKNIFAVDNKKIYSKGDRIDKHLSYRIKELGRKNKANLAELKHTFLLRDFELVFKNSHYHKIFKPKEMNYEILDRIKNIVLEKRIVRELQHIKRKFYYTYKHILNVTTLILKIILFFDLKDYSFELTAHIGLTHDLGKSRISKKILYKTEKLSSEEWQLIQSHPTISYLLLLYYPIKYKAECLTASFEHHEKFDGSGYPRGIKHLSRYTNLIAPADILDALLSTRPYRKVPFSLRAALDCLQEEAEQDKIDKRTVYYLISLSREDKPAIEDMEVGEKWRKDPPENNFYGMRGS